ncbi:hypothetical protein APA_1178 [Pseudanabaena sp. lw0831]|uniref:hypothetical protein n=1 Tax=Pseudanabaena sp. lw0831 TaxID=1357935 RepID=UPI001915DC58|nr:hypothetical protein [Pseudanabaena sp. lw0831]GBO53271.1 hypothetical protein APA_1178 [Pseudanabaena sp. lw0831]
MNKSINQGITQAGLLSFIGFMAGIVSGWSGAIAGGSPADIGAINANIYLALILILPIAILIWNAIAIGQEDRDIFSNVASLSLTMAIAAILGCIAATTLFMLVTVQISTVFKGLDRVQLSIALMSAIGWFKFVVLLAATCTSAIVAGMLNYRKFRNSSS